jgi:hypothetical protein
MNKIKIKNLINFLRMLLLTNIIILVLLIIYNHGHFEEKQREHLRL